MKRMKKIFVVIMAMVTCLTLLTACDKGKEEKRVIKVGMEIGYPPFEYYGEDGSTPVGIDVELAKALGEEIGADIELINTAWDGIFDGLNSGNYDCIISAVTITPERAQEFEFTDPYIQNYQCIVALKDGSIKPSDLSECAGIRLGYQEETISDHFIADYAEANNIEIETYEYAKVMDCFSDMELGRLDAVICDSTVADSYVSDADSIYEITWIKDSDPEEFGICVKKGNAELCNELNTALNTLKSNGKLEQIFKNNY